MQEQKLRIFVYHCNCGHQVKVFSDAGMPQEFYKCRRCGAQLKREEG